jgi:hypothetical protein
MNFFNTGRFIIVVLILVILAIVIEGLIFGWKYAFGFSSSSIILLLISAYHITVLIPQFKRKK